MSFNLGEFIQQTKKKAFEEEFGTGAVRATDRQKGTNYALAGYETVRLPSGGGSRRPVYVPINQQAPAPVAEAPAQQARSTSQTRQPSELQKLKVGKVKEPAGPTMEDVASMFAENIASMQSGLQESMMQQQQMFMDMQAAQSERMEALTTSLMNAQMANQPRPQVMGIKSATSTAGTPMSIARRGVTGAFGRSGMRIQNLNV